MKSSTRVILVVPLIGLTLYMAWAGILHRKLLSWGEGQTDWWYGRSAILGGFVPCGNILTGSVSLSGPAPPANVQ
ncbi:MAG TPA: hypothetical protein VNZ64_16805 [Candidatus Acidoferrum sp.]|jgi:hypothetical protein|nr:hypothetical protein [Candidatus Acidoferrum sp.]